MKRRVASGLKKVNPEDKDISGLTTQTKIL
jgi:hypothetical protein